MSTITFDRAAAIEETVDEVKGFAHVLPLVIVIHELPELRIRFLSDFGLRLIGKPWDEVEKMPYEDFMQRYFNPEHFQHVSDKIVGLLSSTKTDEVISYFQQVRTSPTLEFDWYLNTCKVLLRDQDNAPILLLTTALRVDPEEPFISKAGKILEENAFIKNHYDRFAKLGSREKDVLRLLALGKSSGEIAAELHISTATADTHRRNIRKKLNCSNNYELNMYARAFDLI